MNPNWRSAALWGIALMLVLGAAWGLYRLTGHPDALNPTSPDALLEQAVDVAMRQPERGLAGEPERLIAEALRLAPQHVQALALAGSARFDQKDYAGAIRHWEPLLERVEPGSDLARQIEGSLATARRLAQAGASAPAR